MSRTFPGLVLLAILLATWPAASFGAAERASPLAFEAAALSDLDRVTGFGVDPIELLPQMQTSSPAGSGTKIDAAGAENNSLNPVSGAGGGPADMSNGQGSDVTGPIAVSDQAQLPPLAGTPPIADTPPDTPPSIPDPSPVAETPSTPTGPYSVITRNLTGTNGISGSAFSGATGLVTSIQNLGDNVVIHNITNVTVNIR